MSEPRPFASIRDFAEGVLKECKSPEVLRAYPDLCIHAAFIRHMPRGMGVSPRPDFVRRAVEELAASLVNKDGVVNGLMKRAGELAADLRRRLGEAAPEEAILAELADRLVKLLKPA
jgi:hypothetical protein